MLDQQQTNLVDELSMLNPVLFASYKKTEEVAINHWYPGMTQSNGSVNSYPHVQGIIYQLSIVLYHPQCVIKLTDVELYLLLTSKLPVFGGFSDVWKDIPLGVLAYHA